MVIIIIGDLLGLWVGRRRQRSDNVAALLA
jgi:hypothetical protein